MASKKKNEPQRSGWQEIIGIFLLAASILLFMSLISYDADDISWVRSPPQVPPHNFIGPLGAWSAFLAFMGFGVGAYLLPLGMVTIGVLGLLLRDGGLGRKAAWVAVALLSLVGLFELMPELFERLITEHLNVTSSGGLWGQLLAQKVLITVIGKIGAAILLCTLILVAMVILFEVHPVHFAADLWRGLLGSAAALLAFVRGRFGVADEEEEAGGIFDLEPKPKKKRKRRRKKEPEPLPETLGGLAEAMDAGPDPTPEPEVILPPPTPKAEKKRKAPRPGKKKALDPEEEAAEKDELAGIRITEGSGEKRWQRPPLSILDELPPAARRDIEHDPAIKNLLTKTLKEFGVDAEVINVERGPVVTSFEVRPAPGVRVEKIANLSKNLALALKAESIRVQAPIPGKGVVGIEIPNGKSTIVYAREMIESRVWKTSKAVLPLMLGVDVSGKKVVADMNDMPHMLIAGATGSGKSVCMNSLLAGLLMNCTPDELRLILVDPKIVEFTAFQDLPHLVVPVINDPKKVGLGLRWAINEMEKRYKLFARVGVRNIKGYNARRKSDQQDLFDSAPASPDTASPTEEKNGPPDTLPYIVLVIDELADLMMVAQAEIENYIARLAQLSRAVGIHMILATQRPSVNVITGTIKANFPARIAFQVAQKVDSRTILDTMGADALLGKGDLLFMPPSSPRLIRAQGAMTTDDEVTRIVDFYKEQGQPEYEVEVKKKIESKVPEIVESDEDNELVLQAIEIIKQTRRASTSSLQRRLRIGYNRAARLMDQLEERGVVGPPQGADPREILVDLDGDIPDNNETAPNDEA